MEKFLLFCCIVIVAVTGESDQWAWKDDGKKEERNSAPRYQIHENPDHEDFDDFDGNGPLGFRPENTGPYGPNSRPIAPGYHGDKGVLVGPGGPTGVVHRPHYPGHGHEHEHGHIDEGISNSGFLPSWIRDDPRYRDYDTCKCRYSFNCPSTGLKFGSCSRDKKYCCFNSRKYPGLVSPGFGSGHQSFRPGQPNKYGPVSFLPNYQGNRRPQGNFYSGHRNPHGNYQFPREETNNYDPNHYGNPYEAAASFDFEARSSSKNQTAAKEQSDSP